MHRAFCLFGAIMNSFRYGNTYTLWGGVGPEGFGEVVRCANVISVGVILNRVALDRNPLLHNKRPGRYAIIYMLRLPLRRVVHSPRTLCHLRDAIPIFLSRTPSTGRYVGLILSTNQYRRISANTTVKTLVSVVGPSDRKFCLQRAINDMEHW